MNKDEKRFLKKAILVFLIVVIVVSVVHMLGKPSVEAWEWHAVSTGDTLWSIAKEHNPDYTGDIRHITYQIKKANGMDSSAIMAGDVLEVPVMEF